MLIYEVNIEADRSIAEAYKQWLKEHIRQMLAFDGFETAELYQPEHDGAVTDERVRWTVAYRVCDKRSLDDYLSRHAAAMRADGQRRFGDRFSATRRILQTLERVDR